MTPNDPVTPPGPAPDPGPHAGDPRDTALPELVEREGARLFSLASRFCGSRDEAEDLVQEVFLEAWKHWDGFEGRSSVGTWLYTIAARACQRRHRPRAGEPERVESLDELLPFGSSRMALLPAGGGEPVDEVLAAEDLARVEAAVAALPTEFRMPLVLKEVAGLSLADIGRVLGIPEATVKTRVHRARLKLRQAVDEGLEHGEGPPPAYPREVCLDLLAAKQRSLDEGVAFAFPDGVVCERCASVFGTLDLAQAACREVAAGHLPEDLREAVLGRFREAGGST